MPPALVVFDVNETLFPLTPVAAAARSAGLDDAAFAEWFARVLRDGFAAAAAGTVAGFAELARYHLADLLRQRGAPAAGQAIEAVVGAFQAVTPHPDVQPAFARLHAAGVSIATLTNGSVAVTESFLRRATLDGYVTGVYDVSTWGAWKPRPEPYRGVTRALGVAPTATAMVAAHPWDVHGACQAGLRGCWVNRDGAARPPFFAAPDVEAASLDGVVDRLLATPVT